MNGCPLTRSQTFESESTPSWVCWSDKKGIWPEETGNSYYISRIINLHIAILQKIPLIHSQTSYLFFFLKIWNYTVQIVKGRDLKSWQYSLIGKSNDSLIRIAWSNPKSFSKAGMQLWIVREAWLTQWACSNVLFAMGWPFVQSGGREAVCSKTQCSSWFQVEREK